MKIIFIILFAVILNCYDAYSQDTIVQTNGQIVICNIQNQDSSTVYLILKRKGVKVSSSIKKSEIASIRRGPDQTNQSNQQNRTITIDKVSFGLGLGLDYGGIGGNLLMYPHKNFGIFFGVGYAIIDVGYNIGVKIRFISSKQTSSINGYLIGMYGYNAAIKVTGAANLSRMFYGPSLGFGFDCGPRYSKKGYWCFDVLFPIRDPKAERFVNYYGGNSLLPITISFGYRIILN
jgi:hypothetical protein